MSLDTELETWRRDWQSENAVPADLRRRVERQSRWLKIGLAGDILVTVTIGGGVVAAAAVLPQTGMLLLVAATWSFIAIAWAFRADDYARPLVSDGDRYGGVRGSVGAAMPLPVEGHGIRRRPLCRRVWHSVWDGFIVTPRRACRPWTGWRSG